jgi:phospholipid/cholesterol/gamma-HCH transport system permease protein
MKFTEEVDALRTFGLPPWCFWPCARDRRHAGDAAAHGVRHSRRLLAAPGGTTLVEPATTYWQHVVKATRAHILLGLFKAAVFGLLVGLVGCSHGFQSGRTADAVGRAATAAVVGSLILITVFDGLFAVLFYVLGI